jgi:hypothetical protein
MKTLAVSILLLICLMAASALILGDSKAQTNTGNLGSSSTEVAQVQVGVYIIDIQSINLADSNYQLDFYLWFNYKATQINASEVSQFEFVNGQPTIKQISASDGYIEYRVTGTFLKTFDFTNYPFESHTLYIELEHDNLDNSQLVYTIDPTTTIESTAGLAVWNTGSLSSQTAVHSYGDQSFSRPEFDITIGRPIISGVIKSVLPISIITGISLLAFALAAEDYSQKMALGITTLLSATAFHLSLISGIPPTGYLTLADRMMIGVYILFLYNIGSAVYLMTLARKGKKEQATAYNRKSQIFLPIAIAAVLVMIALV